jgi:hypothetical protein
VRAAVAVVGAIGKRRALDGLTTASALHRRAVHKQKVVIEPRALAGEHAHQPLQGLAQSTATLEVASLAGDAREQVAQVLFGDREKPSIGRYAHDRLGDAERDDLCVCDASPGVLRSFRQEIVSRHVNGCEQQVEVGVHRGPLWSAMLLSTADFDPAAQKPPMSTALTVESII